MGEFVTGQVARERIGVLLDRVDDAYAELRQLSSDEVGTGFRLAMAERFEHQQRTNRGLMYRVFGELARPPDEAGPAPGWTDKIWARVRIAPNEIRRRVKVAELIRPRRSLTGPPLPPELPVLAEAVEQGVIGDDHLRVIEEALKKLPSNTSEQDRTEVQTSLVREASKNDAEVLRQVARKIDEIFNPDGHYDEKDRERRRGLTLGRQGRDGMSRLSGYVDPETRCYVEAVAAAVRPGRHLPDGTTEEVRDERSAAQRCHDGIKLGLKAGIASGGLGAHRGHAVTVIARTTLAELDQAAHAVIDPMVSMPGPARTGGDTALPMRDLIRMAADGIHYLAVFDDHSERPIYLGRQKRVATADQRIVCYARDGGCTRPNCTAPGYHSEVHHCPDWADGGATNADMLFFACGPDHKLVTDGHWRTEVTEAGRLAWTDGTRPAEINHAHHPEELLHTDPDPPDI
ncbi:13E12 repeat family protein [Mycobacterium sp. E740]|uniref:13E12 repeat family protein n=1 Tax=Mycobacterium sp. E740 TaxID=1834149 RepID=UPI0007FC6AE8|nr:13E12 repeat family protein [Mycobacterium sp. E740]OBI71493.1 HNH nuclease [Mycobacterium sp. E740]